MSDDKTPPHLRRKTPVVAPSTSLQEFKDDLKKTLEDDIAALKTRLNAQLTGSRFYGDCRDDSDYDFFAADTPEHRKILEELGYRCNGDWVMRDYSDSGLTGLFRKHAKTSMQIDVQLVNNFEERIMMRDYISNKCLFKYLEAKKDSVTAVAKVWNEAADRVRKDAAKAGKKDPGYYRRVNHAADERAELPIPAKDPTVVNSKKAQDIFDKRAKEKEILQTFSDNPRPDGTPADAAEVSATIMKTGEVNKNSTQYAVESIEAPVYVPEKEYVQKVYKNLVLGNSTGRYPKDAVLEWWKRVREAKVAPAVYSAEFGQPARDAPFTRITNICLEKVVATVVPEKIDELGQIIGSASLTRQGHQMGLDFEKRIPIFGVRGFLADGKLDIITFDVIATK